MASLEMENYICEYPLNEKSATRFDHCKLQNLSKSVFKAHDANENWHQAPGLNYTRAFSHQCTAY